tara:strand:- start:18369 stop:19391 length:1023 start_codon:yes stop_codon:yes gene_type:complete
MAYETIANVPMMASSPEERLLYKQLEANAKKKAKLAAMLGDYRKNPGKYSADQRMFMEQQAMEAGLPMPDTKSNVLKTVGKGLASAADSALFGMLPNELYTPLNQAERMATGVGGLAGMALPFGLPMKAARGAMAAYRGSKAADKVGGMMGTGLGGRFAQGFGWPFAGGTPGVATSASQKVAQQAAKVGRKSKGKFVSPEKIGQRFEQRMQEPQNQADLRSFFAKNANNIGPKGKYKDYNAAAAAWMRGKFGKKGGNPNIWAGLKNYFGGANTPYGDQFWVNFINRGSGGAGQAVQAAGPVLRGIPYRAGNPLFDAARFPQSRNQRNQVGGLLGQAQLSM